MGIVTEGRSTPTASVSPWSQVTRDYSSFHSSNPKYFRPRLACFCIRNSKNIAPSHKTRKPLAGEVFFYVLCGQGESNSRLILASLLRMYIFGSLSLHMQKKRKRCAIGVENSRFPSRVSIGLNWSIHMPMVEHCNMALEIL